MNDSFFVCYAREDYEYVASFKLELDNQLKLKSETLKKYKNIDLKIDQTPGTINLGEKYKDKIEKLIEESSGAILFLSENLSQSKFINEVEVPKILDQKNKNSDYLILPIFVDSAKGVNKEISIYQAPNTENNPLKELSSELRSLIIKKFVKELVEEMSTYDEEKLINTEKLNVRKNLARSLVLIPLLTYFFFTALQNEDTNIVTDDISEINDNVEDSTLVEDSVVSEYKDVTTCVSNTKELFNQQWLEMPFIYYEYNEANYVSCDSFHDGEFFAIYESNLNKDNSAEELWGVYVQTFTLCFDEYKKLSGYSPFEGTHMIEILVFVNERNGSTLDFNCFSLFIDDETEDWESVNISFRDYSKEGLYEEYGYNVTTQEFLTVGTCGLHPFTMYGTGSFADEVVNNSVVVSCNNPHSFEVFDYFTYTPSENESIGEIEDAIANYCHQNADILYSNFTDYENTFFKYIANPEKLKQKEEVVVQCIVMESNIEYGFWIYTKKYDSIKEKLDRRSYQIRSLNLENETSINITNCPDEPIRGFTETQIEDDNYEFFDYKFEWINLDTDQKDKSIIKVDFSDAAYTISFEIDLNTFSKLDVDLSSWNITIPIIWEFIDEQQNNVGKVTIQYIKNGSIVADSVCEVELFNQ